MTATEILKNKAAEQTTDTLMGALFIMEAATTLTAAERMVKAAASDAITERHGIVDQANEIFDDLMFDGTYTDAIAIALAKVAA